MTFDDNFLPQKNSAPTKKGTQAAAFISGAVALTGLYFFISGAAFLDIGHVVLVPFFLVFVSFLFFSIRTFKALPAILSLILCAAVIVVISEKIKWQKDFQHQLKQPGGIWFMLYAERYPRWEEHIFADVLNRPDWIRFTRECVDPLKGGTAPSGLSAPEQPSALAADCRDLKKIKARYRLDMQSHMTDYLKRMRNTARRVKDEKITTKRQYLRCLEQGKCAEVPLLPNDVKAEEIDPYSEAHMDVRKPFWQLVDRGGITPELCNYMTLCTVLERTGAINFEKG